MPPCTQLLLGVHAHQPVGNFPHVIDDAVARCYQPFLETLHRIPEFPFAIHISGWLLGYLAEHHAATLALLQDMVTRGQAELVGAGDTEPVLAAIPHVDRVEQIRAMSERMEKQLGQRPLGAWLTERVWDPAVVPALVEAGIRYVMVDDYHFLCAGADASQLNCFHRTEENGQVIDVFPISEALRYRVPFSEADAAVAYLEGLAQAHPGGAAIYFDDIEKFGVWPETYAWVYEKGWLEQFLRQVLASPCIEPLRYQDYLRSHRPQGVIYLPTVSYSEMNEWTLPAAAARAYAGLVEQEKAAGRFDERKPLIRGGIWKNFLTRYPESNWMHKRMMQLSQRFHALPKKRQSGEMRRALHEAQANDAYWHGLFGGIYLPHLRRAVYNAIVRLEAMLDEVQPRPAVQELDIDLDGAPELLYHNDFMQLIIRPAPTAAVVEWDLYALHHNLGDTLARRDEAYYDKIRNGATASEHNGNGIASAHDRVSYKSTISLDDLVPDTIPCRSFLDRVDTTPVDYAEAAASEWPRFTGAAAGCTVTKTYTLEGQRLIVDYGLSAAHGQGEAQQTFSTHLHLAMPCCDGPAGRIFADGRLLGGFGSTHQGEAREIILQDEVLGGELHFHFDPPAQWQAAPHLTVSQSEAGFEKIMQALALQLHWLVPAGKPYPLRIRMEAKVHA